MISPVLMRPLQGGSVGTPGRRTGLFAGAVLGSIGLLLPASLPGQAALSDSLPPGVTMEMVEQGQGIFEGSGLCSTCHGESGQGLIGPDLTDKDWIQAKGSYLSILQVVTTGVSSDQSATGTEMPARGGSLISDADVHAVAAYVWRTSHPEAAEFPPGLSQEIVDRGREVFAGPGNCFTCHGSDATGLVGPDLTDDVWLDAKGSYLAIVRIIANGVPEEQSTRGIPMPPKGGSAINDAEIEQVAAYVWYLSHR